MVVDCSLLFDWPVFMLSHGWHSVKEYQGSFFSEIKFLHCHHQSFVGKNLQWQCCYFQIQTKCVPNLQGMKTNKQKTISLFASVSRSRLSQLGPDTASTPSSAVGPSFQLEQPGGVPALLLLVSLCQSSFHSHLCKAQLRLWPRGSWRNGWRKSSYPGSPCLFIPSPPPPPFQPWWGGVSPLSSSCRSMHPPSPQSYSPRTLCTQEGPQSSVIRTSPPAAGPWSPEPSNASTSSTASHDAPCPAEEKELLCNQWRCWWRAWQCGWPRRSAPRL